jgi:hypothetical protein
LAELVGPVAYQLSVGDLAGTWLANFDLVVLRLGLSEDERERYVADRRTFSDVNRRFHHQQPQGTWQEFVSAASQSPEGRAALNAWRRTRRLLGFTRAKSEAVAHLLSRHRHSRVHDVRHRTRRTGARADGISCGRAAGTGQLARAQ